MVNEPPVAMIPRTRVSLAWALSLLCCQAVACGGRDDLDGSRRKLPGLAQRGEALALAGAGQRVVFDVYDNRASASVHAGGVLEVDFSSVDVTKYIDGGLGSGWQLGATAGELPAALVGGLAGELYVPLDRAPGGASRRADGSMTIAFEVLPAADNQLVSVFLNEKKLGDVAMPEKAWKTYRVTAPASSLIDGENKLRFYFRHTGELGGVRTAAGFRHVWFGGVGGQQGFSTRSSEREGLASEALALARAGRLSFYVRIPEGRSELAFAAGGAGAEVEVRITSGDTADHSASLWRGQATAAWNSARIALDEYAGDIVRVDFLSNGPVEWARPQLVVPERSSPKVSAAPPAKHVIIWVVAALRADHSSTAALTPSFQRFASRATRFSKAMSAAPEPGPAHVALITGAYPEGRRVVGGKTLGERFREAGYATALISGNGFVNDDAGFARGFDMYANPMRVRRPFRARFLWQRARRFLTERAGDRTLLYIATVEPHLPYTPSAQSLGQSWSDPMAMRFKPAETAGLSRKLAAKSERLSERERRYVRALYEAEVRDADAAFGEMLADLDKLDLRDQTAVILVADHGEELFERGSFGHGSHLHDETLRVPLLVSPAGGVPASVSERPASTVDVYATALDLAGIAINSEAQGRTLLLSDPAGGARPLWAVLPGRARSVRVGAHKLIVPSRGRAQLYHLGLDPGELTDLMGSRPLVERYLRNAFGIGVGFRRVWNPARWGDATNVKPAFAADHGY